VRLMEAHRSRRVQGFAASSHGRCLLQGRELPFLDGNRLRACTDMLGKWGAVPPALAGLGGWPRGPALAGLGWPWGPASERRSRPQSSCGGPQRQQHLPGVLCDRSGSGAAFNLLIWSSGKEVVAGDCLWERSRCLSPAGSEFISVASSSPSGTHGPHRRGRGPHGSRFGGCLQGPRRCAGRTDYYCSVVRVHPWPMTTCVMRALLHLGRRRCQ
jgi:hypothetical protein